MRVNTARTIAAEWVAARAVSLPGFRGALLHGSILDLPPDAELTERSDVDVLLVLDDPDAIAKPGKFRFRGVLLEVSPIAFERVNDPANILGEYNLAPSFRADGVLADRTGVLRSVQREVAAHFADDRWIEARIDQAAEKVRSGFTVVPDAPLHAQVTAWLFSTGVLTHVILVGASRNPTVRKRYVAVRDVLHDRDDLADYERLLGLLGCGDWTSARTSAHLAALEEAFDLAAEVIRSPFFFAADISSDGKSVAIDGSRELIESGFHRESVFWIAATWCRCVDVLTVDGTSEQRALAEPGFRALLADLGVASIEEIEQRKSETGAALDWVVPLARGIEIDGPHPRPFSRCGRRRGLR